MRIYCVRHGESASNAHTGSQKLPFEQGDRLTDRGRQQAQDLGKRLAGEGISRIIASHYARAQETAKEISQVLGLPVETKPDIHEIVQSQQWYAASTPEERAQYYYRTVMEKHSDDPSYTIGGSESFSDLSARAKRFADFLLQHSASDSLLIVSHNAFLNFFLGFVLFGSGFSARNLKVLDRLYLSNTGISVFEHRESFFINGRDFSGWTVHTWNDEAHL